MNNNHECKNCEGCKCDEGKQGVANQQSLWESTAQAPAFNSLKGEVEVDTAIIGGGITGLTTAYLLQKAGQKVAVIEAAKIGMGVTGYTTAHITEQLDVFFTDLVQRFGQEKARLIADSSRGAIEQIEKTVQELGLASDFERVPGYLYAQSAEYIPFLQEEARVGKELGVDVEFTTDVPLPFATTGAVKFNNQAQFHPLKYIYGLAKEVAAKGGHIYEQSRVVDVRGGRVITSEGTVTAKNVVMATHTPILSRLLPIQGMLASKRSYVLGVRLTEGKTITNGLFWETKRPYHYLRSYMHNNQQVVVVGGEDHSSGTTVDTRTYFARLEEYARATFPVASVDYRWSAQYFNSVDELPYIGRVPLMGNLYIATGFSGTGMTFGTVSAMIISDAIMGKAHVWASIYKPTRLSLKGIIKLMQFGVKNMKHVFLDRFASVAAGSPDDLKPGEGRIMRVDGKNTAVYKAEGGKVSKLSPVCTHAGCIVQWNSAEKTWDCPCHGSRFKGDGSVMVGPAVENLKSL